MRVPPHQGGGDDEEYIELSTNVQQRSPSRRSNARPEGPSRPSSPSQPSSPGRPSSPARRSRRGSLDEEAEDTEVRGACNECGKPVLGNEPRLKDDDGVYRHYSCWESARAEVIALERMAKGLDDPDVVQIVTGGKIMDPRPVFDSSKRRPLPQRIGSPEEAIEMDDKRRGVEL